MQKTAVVLVSRNRDLFLKTKEPFFACSEKDLETLLKSLKQRGFKKVFLLGTPETKVKDLEVTSEGVSSELLDSFVEALKVSYPKDPHEIEKESLRFVEERLSRKSLSQSEKEVLKRVVHASGDFSFAETLTFHPEAVKKAIEFLREGKGVVVDVGMVASGIAEEALRKLGGKLIFLDPRTVKPHEGTRTERAMEEVLRRHREEVGIVGVGNSPTALLKAIEVISDWKTPPVVVGVPVGFVRALEVKMLLAKSPYPFVTNLDHKGGSAVCTAIINALLKMALK